MNAPSIFVHTVEDMLGNPVNLSRYAGKVCCIVNIASLCSVAPLNMTQLVAIQRKYAARNFQILAFPCSQFANQEPNTAEKVCAWARDTYGADFPVFGKVFVKGPKAHPLFVQLQNQTGQASWNYTKFLCSAAGEPLRRYEHAMPPSLMEPYIETLLAAGR